MERYHIAYTDTAADDIAEKFQYIDKTLHDHLTAEHWYARLKESIQQDLSFMPEKYPLYSEEPWRSQGVRLFITRHDVVLYSVERSLGTVYILGVCTAGRDLSAHLETTQIDK